MTHSNRKSQPTRSQWCFNCNALRIVLMATIMLLVMYEPAQAQNSIEQSSLVNEAGLDTSSNETTALSSTANKILSSSHPDPQTNKNEPNYLDEMVGYKLQVFKNIHIPPGSNTIYIAAGEQYIAIPESATRGLPFLKIKLMQPADQRKR